VADSNIWHHLRAGSLSALTQLKREL